MRLFAMAALTAIGLGLAATSGGYAAPINATSIGKSASEMSPLTTVYYRRYYHRHGYYYRRYYRPYYYGYGPYYYRPYYYGYGPYYYRPYYHRPFFPFFWW
jgi:hypothetical protein